MFRDKNLPLFPHAAEADFRDVFQTLRVSAEISVSFTMLMILSTLLAGTGLFLNSASVIIGAMILAPLMSPIIALAIGVVRSDAKLITGSLKTLACGLVVAMSFAARFALMVLLQMMTPEMEGRLHPSLLDLWVALLSGIAAAYANARAEVAKSLAGVAIAVALVPPLAVAGIGLGWLNMQMVAGAGLLFLTNLVGIMLASSFTFLILGFAPVKRARRALLLSLALVLVISVPLAMSFRGLMSKSEIRQVVSQWLEENHANDVVEVQDVVFKNNIPVIRLQIRVKNRWDATDLERYKLEFETRLRQRVIVESSLIFVR